MEAVTEQVSRLEQEGFVMIAWVRQVEVPHAQLAAQRETSGEDTPHYIYWHITTAFSCHIAHYNKVQCGDHPADP